MALLVVAPEVSVAAWAAETIEIGPGASITPLVLGPHQIPRIADLGVAARFPGLAVLSARVHGRGRGGEELAPALAAAIASVDRAAAEVYFSYVYEALDTAARRALEELVMAFDVSQIDPNWRFEDTEAGKRLAELYLERLRRKTLAEGRAEALAEGALRARREVLLRFAARAGITFGDEQRARIEACTDSETLDRWIDRAIEARDAAEILG